MQEIKARIKCVGKLKGDIWYCYFTYMSDQSFSGTTQEEAKEQAIEWAVCKCIILNFKETEIYPYIPRPAKPQIGYAVHRLDTAIV